MRYNIIHEKKLIFLWLPKSGTISLMRLMTGLKYGEAINPEQLRRASANEVGKIFSMIKEEEEHGEKYGKYRSFLFGRSQYFRILSGYLDKYVNKKSETPKTAPGPISYANFIALLQNEMVAKGSVATVAKFSTFCPADQDVGYEFYQRIGTPSLSKIFLLECNGFPEGALHHTPATIRTLLRLAEQQDEFKHVRDLVPQQGPRRTQQIFDPEIASWTSEKLWRFIQARGPRSINVRSFYPENVLEMFEQTYSGEFAFYRRQGLTFDRP